MILKWTVSEDYIHFKKMNSAPSNPKEVVSFTEKETHGNQKLERSCRVSHNAKQAITLNSASSKFRIDIIEVIIVTYRLKG